jgi:hypothetical protein
MSVRDRTVLMVIGFAVAIAAGWMLVLAPKRDEASKLQTQITSEQSQLASVRTQLANASAARAQFSKDYSSVVRLGEAVPTDDNTPSLIFQLQAAAKSTGVDFQGLTFNAGSSGGPTGPSSPSSTSSSSSSSSSPSSSSPSSSSPSSSSTSTTSPSSSAAPATQASAATLPPGATIGPAGFPVEPFTFTFTGNFFHLANFFGRLQRFVIASSKRLAVSGRLMTLNGISLGPGSAGFPQITATISATTFLLPASQGLTAGATPAGPATSTTQTVSTPRSSSPAPAAVLTPPVR